MKASYRGINKALSRNINSIDSLIVNLKKAFPTLPEEFDMFYFDSDNDQIKVDNQQDYEIMTQNPKRKIYIKTDTDTSFIRSQISRIEDSRLSLNQSQAIDTQMNFLPSEIKQSLQLHQVNIQKKSTFSEAVTIKIEKQQPSMIKQLQFEKKSQQPIQLKEQDQQVKKQWEKEGEEANQLLEKEFGKFEKVKKQNNPVEKITPQQQIIGQPFKNQEKKIKKFEPIQLHLHSTIICDECKLHGIRGTRYKCTACENYDLCSSCYKKNDHDPRHEFIECTKANDLETKVNLAKSIAYLFNPQSESDGEPAAVGQYISMNNLTEKDQKLATYLWKVSAPLVDQVIADFQEIKKQFQNLSQLKAN